jgi:hypothetical protein
MIIYILVNGLEVTTSDPVLTEMFQAVIDSFLTDADTTALTQAYDSKVIELFGPGARHLGSEQ